MLPALLAVPLVVMLDTSSVALACNNGTVLVSGRQIMVRNNYSTAPINVIGNRNSVSLPNTVAPSACPDGLYRIATVFVDVGNSAFSNTDASYFELGIRYYKSGTTSNIKISVEVADHWDRAGHGLTTMEWDPSYFGCTISPGSGIQPLMQIQQVPAFPGTY